MCVLIDVALSGLFRTSTRSPSPNPVFATRGAMFEMLLLSRYSLSRLVNPDSADTSEMLFLERYSDVRLVNPDSDVMFEILL